MIFAIMCIIVIICRPWVQAMGTILDGLYWVFVIGLFSQFACYRNIDFEDQQIIYDRLLTCVASTTYMLGAYLFAVILALLVYEYWIFIFHVLTIITPFCVISMVVGPAKRFINIPIVSRPLSTD